MRHRQSRRDSSGAWYIDSAALTQVCRDYDAGAAGDRHEIVDYPSRSKPAPKPYPVIVDQAEYEAKYWQRRLIERAWREAVRAHRAAMYR